MKHKSIVNFDKFDVKINLKHFSKIKRGLRFVQQRFKISSRTYYSLYSLTIRIIVAVFSYYMLQTFAVLIWHVIVKTIEIETSTFIVEKDTWFTLAVFNINSINMPDSTIRVEKTLEIIKALNAALYIEIKNPIDKINQAILDGVMINMISLSVGRITTQFFLADIDHY